LVFVEALYVMEKLKHFFVVQQLHLGLAQSVGVNFDSLSLDVYSEIE
jgi:hypothetical protein